MADEQRPQQMQVQVDESKMTTTYANSMRTTTTNDEVVIDFGLNLPMQQGQQRTLVFNAGARVVMTWAGAKRLAQSLSQAVSAYEQRYGPINIEGRITGEG